MMHRGFNILRTANVLIMRYGKEVPICAGKRAEELYRERDFAGCVYWQRTLPLIYELLISELREDAVVH